MVIIIFVFFIIEFSIGRSLFKKNVNPIMSFVGVQLISLLLLYGSSFINISIITPRVLCIYFISFICYTLGCVLGSRPKNYEINQYEMIREDDEQDYQFKIVLLGMILLISTLIYWSACIDSFGMGSFFQQLLHTKPSENTIAVSNIVLYFKMISLFLSPYVLFFIIKYRNKRIINYFILILTFVSNIAYTRNVLFYIVILDLFVIVYSRSNNGKKRSIKRWFLLIAIIIAMFWFFSYTQTEFNKQFIIDGTIFGRNVNGGFLTIVSYFSGGMSTVGLYLEDIANTPFLGHTFRTLIGFLSPLGFSMNTALYQPTQWVYIPFQYNTSSMQYYIFSEGGWLWTIVFFLLFGFAHTKVYYWYINKKSFSGILFLCFFSLMSVLSVREYIMVRLDSFIYLLFATVCYMQESKRLKRIHITFR